MTGALSQRERLTEAAGEVVGTQSYAQSTVEQITRRAGVSRSTFYALFADKRACAIAAQREISERLIAELPSGLEGDNPLERTRSLFGKWAEYAERCPGPFLTVTHETMLVGAEGWAARQRLLVCLADSLAPAEDDAQVLDLPGELVIATGLRLLGLRLRRGEAPNGPLPKELALWLSSYLVPSKQARWQKIESNRTLIGELAASEPSGPAPPLPLPRGRHRQPESLTRRVQRERLLQAAVAAVAARGDVGVSVNEIVRHAGVSREIFYAHFNDRQQALLSAQAAAFERLLGATAGAFFDSSLNWQERVWRGGLAFVSYLLGSPEQVRLLAIESFALGKHGARRLDDAVVAFSLLQEGHAEPNGRASTHRATAEAVAFCLLELVVQGLMAGEPIDCAGTLPLAAYIIISAFQSRTAAEQLIGGQLAELRPQEKPSRQISRNRLIQGARNSSTHTASGG
jgi:AcrR family transcriptional regulator